MHDDARQLCSAHLERATQLEARGELDAANAHYNAALRLEPRLGDAAQAATLPPPFTELAWRRHTAMRAWYRREFDAALARTAQEHPGPALTRLQHAVDVFCGQRPLQRAHPSQRPHDLFVPDLPAQPWLSRDQLPWAGALEAHTDAIRAEFLAVQGQAGFRPYITKAPGKDWLALEGSATWNSFFLYEGAVPNRANMARCVRTLAALEPVPLARSAGNPTEVFFSVLAPGGHIPPHCGLSNAKVVVHLPLIVPPGCTLRVATEERGWREGTVSAFDDSFEHEAWNRSDRLRVVLIFEVWNPQLSEAEILGVSRMLDAVQRFKALRTEVDDAR